MIIAWCLLRNDGALERLNVGTSERQEKAKRKRDFIPRKTRDGEEVSLRKPTHSQE
jgi:hypothetical protein